MGTALEVAAEIAPFPYDEAEATSEALLRHYVAQAIAAWDGFHDGLAQTFGEQEDPNRAAAFAERPELGLLATLAVASTAAAVAIDSARKGYDRYDRAGFLARKLWVLTPEAGSLNGEHEEWLFELADQLGINPADLNRHLNPLDFRSALSLEV